MKANRFNFRAWHPSLKEMCMFIFSENVYDAEVMANFSFLAKNDHPEGKNLLMQSTGLTDKNGVEIFESDVVTDGEYTDEIRWDFGSWKLMPSGELLEETFHLHLEVCGHIHKGVWEETEIGLVDISNSPELLREDE